MTNHKGYKKERLLKVSNLINDIINTEELANKFIAASKATILKYKNHKLITYLSVYSCSYCKLVINNCTKCILNYCLYSNHKDTYEDIYNLVEDGDLLSKAEKSRIRFHTQIITLLNKRKKYLQALNRSAFNKTVDVLKILNNNINNNLIDNLPNTSQ